MDEGGKGVSAEALQREHAFWDAVVSKDKSRFARLLHPDYVGVYRCGCHSGEDEVTSTEGVDIQEFSIEDLKVATHGAETEVISYRFAASGRTDGRDFSVVSNVLSVWVLVGRCWKAMAHAEVQAS